MSALSSLTGASSNLPSTSSSSSTAPISVNGLISGLNTSAIIQGLLAVEQAKITDLENQKQTITTRQAAFDGIEAKVLALQGALTALTSTQNSVFAARTAVSSDTSIATAAAATSAVPGVYNLRVTGLASAGQTASQGFDRLDSAISQGTLQLKIGTTTTTVTVDATNDTLQGLADAINASGAAATAYIVNDGSGDDSQGYRLVLAAKATGVANQVNVVNNLAPTGAGAVQPVFNAGTISSAIPAASLSGTSIVSSNAGTGYTGNSNNVYTFTVVQGGTVGTDNNLQLSYSDSTGANTGTITVNQADAGVLLNAAQGVQVAFAAGTLVSGDTFSVKTFVPTVQAATDAAVTLGSGSGALIATSATNQLSNLIPGVTLSLKKSDLNTPITITVAGDTDAMQKSIDGFVAAFNDTVSTIDQETRYDANTGNAGPLLGDFRTQQLEDQLRAIVVNAVPGANRLMNNLGALGITTDKTGKLVVDDDKLADFLAGNVPGVTANDVRTLFALTGSSTNPGVHFISGSSKTKTSSTPYILQIAQAAEQASLTGTGALAASTVIDDTNNTFTVALDGKTSQPITLAAGTYSRTALAQAVATAINSADELTGATVQAGVAGTNLSLTSNRYGSNSHIAIVGGSALVALGFVGGESADGKDVAGSFLVGGNVEAALGQGQFLTGNQGNANTAALQVRVTLTPADVGAGIQASVSVSNGLAAQLGNLLGDLSDPVTGRFQQVDSDYQAMLERLNERETEQKNFIQARTQQLLAQFTAMEETLSKLQATTNAINALSQSLTSLASTGASTGSNSNRSTTAG